MLAFAACRVKKRGRLRPIRGGKCASAVAGPEARLGVRGMARFSVSSALRCTIADLFQVMRCLSLAFCFAWSWPDGQLGAAELAPPRCRSARTRCIAEDTNAILAFSAQPERVEEIFNRGLLAFTGKTSLEQAWSSIVSAQDTIGIKVVSGPGENSGTRPSVVARSSRASWRRVTRLGKS